MRRSTALAILASLGFVVAFMQQGGDALAQTGKEGFDLVAPATASIQELSSQYNFWVLEVHLKPLRMIPVEISDPKTGERRREFIWYLVYKVINRPLEAVDAQAEAAPSNTFDKSPLPPVFAPEFILVTDDNERKQVYRDEIISQAQAAICKRERRQLKNPVEIVGPIPPVTQPGAKEENALYGLAMWRGVDPDTDYFTVLLIGFSNGYKFVRGPVSYEGLKEAVTAGKLRLSDQVWDTKGDWRGAGEVANLFDDTKNPPATADATPWFYTVAIDRVESDKSVEVWRRTLIQKYWRPGDRFDQSEVEVRRKGDPVWLYRADGNVGQVLPKAAE